MGKESICDGQRSLQAARLFTRMLQDKEKKGGHLMSFEIDTVQEGEEREGAN